MNIYDTKNMKNICYVLSLLMLWCTSCKATPESNLQQNTESKQDSVLKIANARFDAYLPKLENKRVGLIVNHTAKVGEKHLLDTLLALGVDVVKIFAPEHGFRGDADAGAYIKDDKDRQTGLPIISLYGNQKKPPADALADIDVLIFDIQDVGARFYTYISTMHYAMEAAAEAQKSFIVLDRPNPNGFYTDGPVLDTAFRSFVGMHPIPIVHGLTVGEIAHMIQGERWIAGAEHLDLSVILMHNYFPHRRDYALKDAPSPNLPNLRAIQLYPSLCLFEGTNVSVGRGTDAPFQIIGSPFLPSTAFSFVPKPKAGAQNPKHEGKTCYGVDLRENDDRKYDFSLHYLLDFYHKTSDKKSFFNANFFDKLAGTKQLRKQIEAGLSEEEIRGSWRNDLERYKQMSQKYWIYQRLN
ncbi:MAG: DUF1343 domain-containing protein [Bernardetiaceae bacterium]|nr:DUF1343 domain-containing protein [Bernardetiaceae bacterium]